LKQTKEIGYLLAGVRLSLLAIGLRATLNIIPPENVPLKPLGSAIIPRESSMADQYHVVVHEQPAPSDAGVMTQTEVYSYLRARLEGEVVAADAALRELKETGRATVYFENPVGPKIRVEIRRL
jgi:hypothetical protein